MLTWLSLLQPSSRCLRRRLEPFIITARVITHSQCPHPQCTWVRLWSSYTGANPARSCETLFSLSCFRIFKQCKNESLRAAEVLHWQPRILVQETEFFLAWLEIFLKSEFSIFTFEKLHRGPHLVFLALHHLCITCRTSGVNSTCGYHFSPDPYHLYVCVSPGLFFALCPCSWSLSVYIGHQSL